MNIVFFTTGMTRGGAERVIATLSNAFVEMGHQVHIIMLKGDHSEYPLDERVDLVAGKLDAGAKNALKALQFYRAEVEGIAPDVVIAFCLKANLMSCLAKLTGLAFPLIVSERADPFNRKPRNRFLCDRLFKQADAVVCQSEVVADYYRALPGVRNVRVIGNPLNEDSIASEPAAKRSPYLLSVGRLCDQKRQDLALGTLAALLPTYPSLRLKICGTGDKLDVLKEQAEALGIADRVDFEGVVSKVMQVHADATAYLMTSDYEGFPNALIEAVASGIPCVTTDFSPGVAREIIVDGFNGYVVGRDDISAIAMAVARIINGEIDPQSLKKSAADARSNYATSGVAAKWLDAITSVKG